MITANLANKILSLATGKSKTITGVGNCYLALGTLQDEAFREFSGGNNYSRIKLNYNSNEGLTDVWGNVSEGMVSNAKEICSPECTNLSETGSWGTLTHFAIYDAATGGNLLMYDELTDPNGEPDENGKYPPKSLIVTQGQVVVFREGTLQLRIK